MDACLCLPVFRAGSAYALAVAPRSVPDISLHVAHRRGALAFTNVRSAFRGSSRSYPSRMPTREPGYLRPNAKES